MNPVLQITVAVLSALTLACGLVSLAVRYILLPYLKEHLVTPVKQVEKQVTENHHSNAEPTVLDRIDDVQQEVRALARMFDGHMKWSEGWVERVEADVEETKKRQRRGWFK